MQRQLDFETPQFLHSLFANNPKELDYLENELGVKAVTREAWIRFEGEEAAVDCACRSFKDLEQARRSGAQIAPREFRMAVDLAKERAEQTVANLGEIELLRSRRGKPITARSPMQLDYLHKMQENEVVFGLGPAGTGKTYLAMAMALTMLRNKEVSRLILTRPAVEAGEALGFLPGDLHEKVAPYLRPLYDALHDMLTPPESQKYFDQGVIEIAPLAYMRGRTLARSFVILDEAQNTTREQMFMFLTRLGEDSRCLITGDTSQIDLGPRVPSGLLEAEQALKETKGVAFTRFSSKDVVRHPVVARIINAYDRHRGSKKKE